MKIGRLVAGAGALTAAGLVLAPGVASAHTADADATCDGLVVSVLLYPEGVTTTIVIDGATTTREGAVNETFPWSSTSNHTWSVHVDGVAENTDKSFGGTEQPCVETTTTTTEAPTTTTTEPAASTTQPPLVTTTVPGLPTTTTPPEVTQVLQESTTTTAAPATSTTTTTVAAAGSGGSGQTRGTLPATGSTSTPLVVGAAVTLLAGGALWLTARRRSAG